MMYIIIALLLWTVISIVYFTSRIGYKNPSRGIRKYIEYVICPPTLGIAYVIGTIGYLIQKPHPPMVSTGLCADLRIDGEGKKYYTQISVFGAKGSYWYIYVYSDDKPISMTWSPPDDKE